MTVRELNKTDSKLFKTIRLRALASDPDAFGETIATARLTSDVQWETRLAEILDGKSSVFLVQDGPDPVGMCAVGQDASDVQAAFFWGVFVDSGHRKSGIGSLLMQSAEAWARNRKCLIVRTKVASPNEGAITFYKRLGYLIGSQVGTLRPDAQIPVFLIHKNLHC